LPLQRSAHPTNAIPDGTRPRTDVIPDGAQRRAGIQQVLPQVPLDPRLRGDDEGNELFDGIPDDLLPGAGR
ncbi:hypothetical protein, partial [Metallibacterium scheffleri]